MKTCKLCLSNPAEQRNSHIIPRFFGVSLLTTPDGKRKGFQIDSKTIQPGTKQKPMQDTPKEDFIVCMSCEKKISEWERKFANEFFNKLKNPKNAGESIELISPNGCKFRRVEEVDYKNLKLTLYSMLWRAYISSLPYFADLELSHETANMLRQVLHDEIEFVDIPAIIIKASSDCDPTKNFIYASTCSEKEYILWANEYIIFFDFGSTNSPLKLFSDIAITEENGVKIGILPFDIWDDIRNQIIDIKIMNEKQKLKNN